MITILISLLSLLSIGNVVIKPIYTEEKLVIEVPASLLGKEFVFSTMVTATSDINETILGYRPCPQEIVRFDLVDSMIVLSKVNNMLYSSGSNQNIDSALKYSNAPSVLYTSKISKVVDSLKYQCDFTSFFVKDRNYFNPKDIKAYYGMDGFVTRDYKFKRGASKIVSTSSNSDGFSISTDLSFGVTRSLFAITEIAKDEPFTATVQSSFFLINELSNYTPKVYNPNYGVDYISQIVFDEYNQGSKKQFYATRWNLNGANSILTFYVDSLMPEYLYQAILDAANMWNKGFVKAGLGEVIDLRKKDFSKEIELGYSTIRYSKSLLKDIRSNIISNLRTGEIISADIFVGAQIVAQMKKEVNLRCGLNDNLILPLLTSEFAYHFGKCLGFVENNGASYDIPVDSLRSVSYTSQHGISNSVMDILRVNTIATKDEIAKGVKWYQDRLGSYDELLISWLYGDKEIDTNNYFFGNKYSSSKYTDPRAISWDMGDDNILSTKLALSNIYFAIDGLCAQFDNEDKDYSYRKDFVDFVVEKYFHYSNAVLQNIGGVYLYNNYNKETEKYEFLPAQRQEESLKYILELTQESSKLDIPSFTDYADLNSSVSEFVAKEFFSITLKKISKLSEWSENSFKRVDGMNIIYEFFWNNKNNIDIYSLRNKRMQIEFVKVLEKLSNGDEIEVAQINELKYKLIKKLEKGLSIKDDYKRAHNKYLLSILKNNL